MDILSRYTKGEYSSYEDFVKNFKIDIPENFNFGFDVVDAWADLKPDKRALVWCNDEGDKKTITFGELKKLSNKTVNFLKRIGVKKGDNVMVVLRRHFEYWICAVALHKLGAVLIPATTQLKTKDVIYRIQAASVTTIIVSDTADLSKDVEEAEKVCPSLKNKVLCCGKRDGWLCFDEEIEGESDEFSRPIGAEATKNDDTLLMYFTSGTTGYPKMARHCHTYPLGHIITAKYWHNVEEDALHLTVAETGWAKSSWGKIYGQWLCGAAIFVYDYSTRFTPVDILKKIEEYKITTFCAPPTILRFLIKEDITKFDLSSLKHCTTAGEALNAEIFNKFYEATGLKIHEGFGQTETVVALANYPWFEPRPGSLGKPSPSYEIHLLDDNGNDCEDGKAGQIAFKTSERKPYGLFCGYYLDDEKTQSCWHDGYYYTGDIAWCDEDGYYWYVGRADDMIKSSGYRIGPFEVESSLMEHPSVLEVAVTAVPDEIRGQIVKATIVLAKGYEGSDELIKELQNHVKATTAPYKYPRIIEFVEELPKTSSGKIMRTKIRERDNK